VREVIITPPENSTRKGRSFTATCLALVEADTLWDGGMISDDTRPVFAMFAGSDAEMRPFQANLRMGKKAHFLNDNRRSYRKKTDRIEFLRSADYEYTWQREVEGTILTVCLKELFQLDPGMVDPAGARFVVLPSKTWVAEQKMDPRSAVMHVRGLAYKGLENEELENEELERLVPIASLFAVYLDRRTRCPIVMDERFYLQLFLAALGKGLASWPYDGGYRDEFGVNQKLRFSQQTEDVGCFEKGIAFNATHERIEELLAEQTTAFFEATSGAT
jgi:hypothetical protein